MSSKLPCVKFQVSKLFEERIYVKPLDTSENALWGVFKMSIVESFFDDWMRYGLSVALGNVQTEYTLLMLGK